MDCNTIQVLLLKTKMRRVLVCFELTNVFKIVRLSETMEIFTFCLALCALHNNPVKGHEIFYTESKERLRGELKIYVILILI